MSDRVRKGKFRRFGYWECLRAARSSGSLPPLAVGNEFDSRPYSHVVYDLTSESPRGNLWRGRQVRTRARNIWYNMRLI